jgi:hypothetical protein
MLPRELFDQARVQGFDKAHVGHCCVEGFRGLEPRA